MGEKCTISRNQFNADALNGLAHSINDNATVRTMRYQNPRRHDRTDNKDRRATKDRRERKPFTPKDTTLSCKACLNIGHCFTKGNLCYILAKATLCQSFLSIPSNNDYVKQINISFRRERKEKSQKAKTNRRMRGIINRMTDAGGTAKEIDPIINLAREFEDDTESDDNFSDDDEDHE